MATNLQKVDHLQFHLPWDNKSMCFAHAQMDVSAETRGQLDRSLRVKGFSTLDLHQTRISEEDSDKTCMSL